MAKNYTFKEAVEIINAGKDTEAISEIGKRFPILMLKTAKVCALAGEDFVDLMSFLPDHVTANKINSVIKGSALEDAGDDENGDTEEEATEETAKDYSEMNNKELKAALRKAGFKSSEIKGKNKAAMLEMLNAGTSTKEEAEDESEDENPYEGIPAPELFKECKKRGLKTSPKKPAKYYIDLLTKSDAEAAKATDAEEDDDWEDEAPKKEEKKSAKKATKKEEPEDDDDDWDI